MITTNRTANEDERIRRLVAVGLVRLPTHPPDSTLEWALITTVDGSSVVQAFLDDRIDDR